MVPDLIWAPDFFGPQEIWSPRSMAPHEPYDDFHAGLKFLGDQISKGPNLLGPKSLRAQTCCELKNSWAQMRLGTISVIAI